MIQLPPLAQYLLESSCCLLAFYLLYRWLFQRYTFFQLNRFYLLGAALLSFLIPLLHLQYQAEEGELLKVVIDNSAYWTVTFNEGLEETRPLPTLSMVDVIWYVYLLGVGLFSFHFIRKIYTIYRLVVQRKIAKEKGIKVLQTQEQDTSSFFNWLFFHPRHDGKARELILEHEKVHIRQWHSLDVLLMEVLLIANWFNPIMHIYRRSLREVHEYIADHYVTQKTQNTYEYAQLLVQEATQNRPARLAHPFASLIKKRLLMLSTHPSKKRRVWAYLSVLPLSACLLLLFSFNMADPMSGWNDLDEKLDEWAEKPMGEIYTPENPKESLEPPLTETNEVQSAEKDTLPERMVKYFLNADKMPLYGKDCYTLPQEEGQKCSNLAMMDYIAKHIRYPKPSKEKGVEGMVILQFIVEKDGSMSFKGKRNEIILREPDRHCGEEALRVAKTMGKWQPAYQNGQAVAVRYLMPVIFRLDNGKAEHVPIPPPPPAPPAPPSPNDPTVFKVVDKMPTYGEGCADLKGTVERKKCSDNAIVTYIGEQVKYPEEARKQGIEGTAVVRFIVEKDGSLTFGDRAILRDPGAGCGKEALRVISQMERWTPGIQDGKPVRVQFTLPIRFKLQDEEDEKQESPAED